jgi:hypothetical protein
MLRASSGPVIPTPPVAGYVLYENADSFIGSPGSVASWPDLSENGNTATQATVSAQPVAAIGGPDGHMQIVFDGVDDGMTTVLLLPSPYTIFIVGNNISNGGRMLQSGTQNRVICFNRGTDAVYVEGDVVAATVVNPGTAWAIGVLGIGASSKSKWTLNGVDRTDDPGRGGNEWGQVTLNGTGLLSGDVSQAKLGIVLIYPTALSDAARQSVQAWLHTQYPSIVLGQPQITTLDFTGLTGAYLLATGGSTGLGFVFPAANGITYGIWFNVDIGQSQPDMSSSGVTSYIQLNVGSGANATDCCASLFNNIGSGNPGSPWIPTDPAGAAFLNATDKVNNAVASAADFNLNQGGTNFVPTVIKTGIQNQ